MESTENYHQLIQNLEFDESFLLFIAELKKTLRDDWDAVVALTGIREGCGKSTLEILIGYLVDNKFDLEKNISYLPTSKEVQDKFNSLGQFQLLGIDEAIKVLYKLRWMDKLQVMINEMYATERKQNKATVLCIPRIRDLNEQFRNHKVHINIHVVARGYAVAFIRDDFNYASQDPWHLKETEKLLEKIRHNRRIMEIGLDERMDIYRKVPNYFFDFVFPQLPEEIEGEYKRIGMVHRAEKYDKEADSKKRTAKMLRGKMKQKEIASIVGVDEGTVSRWFKEDRLTIVA